MVQQFTCSFRPAARTVVQWAKLDLASLYALHAGGIVNPFGPTFYILALDQAPAPAADRRVIEIVLNPFQQACELVGRAQTFESWAPVDDILPFLLDSQVGCMTLHLPHKSLGPDGAVGLCAAYFLGKPGARKVMDLGRMSPRPSERAYIEMVGAFNGKHIRDLPALTPSEAKFLASTVLKGHAAEWEAFRKSWDVASLLNRTHRATLSFERLQSILKYIERTCRHPGVNE